jgi:hypothetical protein
MEVHCTTCGEPWDTYHLTHEAICDTGIPMEEIVEWRKLPPEEKLASSVRQEFENAGWYFGRSLMNVTKCPACPPGALPDRDKLYMKAELEAMLAGDDDGLAAHYEDLGL